MSVVEGRNPEATSLASTTGQPATKNNLEKARRLGVLGYLLQLLHVLFGVTAIIGMLINHTRLDDVKNTFVESHIRWQLTTFWLLTAAYIAAFFYWHSSGNTALIILVLAVALYRIGRGWWQLARQQSVGSLW